jgi:hypothetical protein
VDDWMLELAQDTLGCKLQIVERWQGVYGAKGPHPFSRLDVAPGLTATLMHAGVGMSVGPALGERVVASLFGEED